MNITFVVFIVFIMGLLQISLAASIINILSNDNELVFDQVTSSPPIDVKFVNVVKSSTTMDKSTKRNVIKHSQSNCLTLCKNIPDSK